MSNDEIVTAITAALAAAASVPNLQEQLAASQAALTQANDGLASASLQVKELQAQNATLQAQIADLKAQIPPPAPPQPEPQPDPPKTDPTPAPTPDPKPPATYRELTVGATVAFAGQKWAAQTPRILAGSDGSFVFKAKAGDRANFDPPRKIRTELIGSRQFAKGEEMRLKGTFRVDPGTVLTGAEWCSLIQIHQADTRRADGTSVMASPMFAFDMLADPKTGKPYLQVRGETGRGEQKTFSATRILGKLPDVVLGQEHQFEMRVVDGHGGVGRISVWVDNKAIVDRSDIPTGYEYVDLLQSAYLIRGAPQPNTSYIKLGIYSGKGAGDVPPPAVNVGLTWHSLATQ